MKIHSIKLTIQDAPSSGKEEPVAHIFGTLFIDNGTLKQNDDGSVFLDEEFQPVPIYDTIQFVDRLDRSTEFKSCIQAIIVEALTLKNLELAKEDGTFAQYVQQVTGQKPKRGSRSSKSKK